MSRATTRLSVPTFKLAIVGNVSVGKSSLFLRLRDDQFTTTDHVNTIGLDSTTLTLQIDGVTVQLMLWDTAGQERFRTLTQSFYRDVDGVLLCCSVDAPSSLNDLHLWNNDVRKFAPTALKFVLLNKNDLELQLHTHLVTAFADRNDCTHVFSTSAKTGQGVGEMIDKVGQHLLRKYRQEKLDTNNSWTNQSIHVNHHGNQDKNNSSCC